MKKEELLIEIIERLLVNRDFFGLQLDLTCGNVSTIDYLVLVEEYLELLEGQDVLNLTDKINFILDVFPDTDVETLSVMLGCSVEDVEEHVE